MTATVEPGIDRRWLLDLYEADPVAHGFSRWDIDHAPGQCRFVTLVRDGHPASYLLIWSGAPELPVVHWCGDRTPERALGEAFPARPFVGVVPESVAALVAELRGPVVQSPLIVMVRGRLSTLPRSRGPHVVRRLLRHDLAELQRLVQGQNDPVANAYRTIDPEAGQVCGAFLGGRLVGVARAQVVLPEIWFVTGVFTAPSARNRGIGGDVTAALSAAAEGSGARTALVVREDNGPARRAYERIGFRPVGRRVHVLAGSELRN
jgi:GNAT superfamily N-acetyltransferase